MPHCEFDGLALLLLAAGRGTRFGGGKLAATLGGKAVAVHAAERLGALPFARKFAVVNDQTPDLPGFERLALAPMDAPQSRSLAIAVAAAKAAGARGVMVALADMPLVPESHVRALVDAFDGDRLASRSGAVTMPPALFGAQHFDALMALDGDRGAGALLQDAPFIPLPAGAEIDIDCPDDLARAAALLEG
jgi:molybdenum cofactor cytidylyltransferase